nr:hypothetical protein mgb_00003 [uncultured bacterium]
MPWRVDGNMAAGQQHALFLRVSIHSKSDAVGANTCDIEKSITLCRGTVGSDCLPFVYHFIDECPQISADLFYPLTKGGVRVDSIQFHARLIHTNFGQAGLYRMHIRMSHKNTQGSSMSRQHLNVKHLKTYGLHQLFHEQEQKIRIMLMVYRVELAESNEIGQMRKFESSNARRLQQYHKTGNEITEIGHMSQDIVRHH